MNPDEVVSLVNHASQQSDRWLFIALLVILITGGLIIIRFLFTQLEKQREAHAVNNEKMSVALYRCAEVMEKLEIYLRHLPASADIRTPPR